MDLFGESSASYARILLAESVDQRSKVRAVTGREAGRDNVPVADALPGRPDAAVGASTDFEDVDRHQPRRAHLRQ